MPNMDGQEAIEKIHDMEVQMGIRQNNKAFIIMTTSRAESDDVKNAIMRVSSASALIIP
jgi:CheY-like chemotaxis protein